MSGIVGGISLRSSGLVNTSSASDGQVFTGTGAGLPVGFESAVGGGKILQVLQSTKLDTSSTSSTSLADISGLSIAITPASGTKVLVLVDVKTSGDDSGSVTSLVRGSTEIYIATTIGSTPTGASTLTYEQHSSGIQSHAPIFLDTHGADGSTEITYKLQFKVPSGSSVVYVNRSRLAGASSATPASSITVMEYDA